MPRSAPTLGYADAPHHPLAQAQDLQDARTRVGMLFRAPQQARESQKSKTQWVL
jgi:hypothetical protein